MIERCQQCGGKIYLDRASNHVVTLAKAWFHVNPLRRHVPVLRKGL